ncbi:TPA: DUF2142 domain-containing protein [Streptococcus suis]
MTYVQKKLFDYVTPVRFFIFTAMFFGLIFYKIYPPMSAPDEIGHFAKAYAFSEGKVIPYFKNVDSNPYSSWDKYGFDLPDDINDLNEDSIGVVLNPDQKYDYSTLEDSKYLVSSLEFTGLGGQLNYSFIQYIPQVTGILFAKSFSSSVVTQYLYAKIFNLFVYVFIIALAIQLFQFSKWSVVLLALNPLSLELATSASGDSFTNALSFLFVALLSKFIVEKNLKVAELYLSFLLIFALIQMKPTLITLGMLYFIIPNESLSWIKKIIYGFVVVLISLKFYYLWGKQFPSQQIMYQDFTDSKAQIDSIVQNPINFINILWNTILTKTSFLLRSYSGQFSALNRNLPFLLVAYYYASISIVSFDFEVKDKILTVINKVVLLILMIGYVLLTFTALYQIWTPVGSTEVIGLQGRYFIPLSLVFIMILNSRKFTLSSNKIKKIAIISIWSILVYTTIFLVLSYGFFKD